MILINHDITNPYAVYGLNHFLSKYGISAEINKNKKPDIEIRYNDLIKNDGDITLQIFSNNTHREIIGYLTIGNEIAPLFETPKKLNVEGSVLATFQNKNHSYPCVMVADNRLIIGFDLFNEIGHILSGCLETIFNEQNAESKKLMKIPVVDILEKLLFDSLQFICQKNGIDFEHKPFWPNDKKFAVCLTHDVDRVLKTYQYLTHFIKYLEKKDFFGAVNQIQSISKKLRGTEPYWNFERIMEMEKECGVKSTFFFLNEQEKVKLFSPSEWKLYLGRYNIKDPDIVEMMNRLDGGGWEIGIHGSYNSYNDPKRLEKEKIVLEELLGKKIHGISQHYLNFNIPETWIYYEKLGLVYSTTMGFVSGVGFRLGTSHPYRPFNPEDGKHIDLWELPITIMDNVLTHDNSGWDEIINSLDIVEKYNGVLLLRWHQRVFNEHEFPGRLGAYKKLIEICKEKNAWITNAYNIAEWLTMREENKHFIMEKTL